jgi:hypothetical protein
MPTASEFEMKVLSTAAMLSVFPFLAAASTIEDSMKSYVETEVRSRLADPIIVTAVSEANTANAALSPDDIQTLDGQWRAEVGKDSTLIKAVAQNPTSAILRDLVMASGGKVTEVILMDAQGLNVAVSDVTSDYWQGDEDKYTQTYAVGPRAVHVSEVEFDESSQTYQAQVSFTITDPASGTAIGAATIGLNAEAF